MTATAAREPDTAQRILDLAERLIQVRGYNGFSYADIAEAMQVTKASLYYHFPTKAELGRSVMERYTLEFLTALGKIDRLTTGSVRKLENYVGIYSAVLAGGRMCLCGMLAAEFATLPASVRTEVTRFFDVNEDWLATVLDEGRLSDKLRFEGPPIEVARVFVASLEGAMMLARTYDDVGRFKHAGRRMIAQLRPR